MAAKTYSEYTGIEKGAILMIALGPEKSSSVFKHLKDEEIEELTLEIANTRSVSPEIKDAVLDEFYEICLAQQYISEGGIGYARDLLEKALGADKAQTVIGKLTASLQVSIRRLLHLYFRICQHLRLQLLYLLCHLKNSLMLQGV